jgi:deoxyribodipyrimidine photo-lyase
VRTALVWFRRDLRVHDHPALTGAVRTYDRVVPVFVLDDALLSGRAASAARAEFLAGCLRSLDEELRLRGAGLVVRAGRPESELIRLARDTGAEAVFWTSDVSPYARARDARVTEALHAAGIRARPHGGTYIVDVSKPRTNSGAPYSVFSPFFRTWKDMPRRQVLPAPDRVAGVEADSVSFNPAPLVAEPVVEPGEAAARRAANAWLEDRVAGYAVRHDRVGEQGTSRLSPYLRWGCLSALELEQSARDRRAPGPQAWIRQLCWRDFYAHVLLHWPSNLTTEFQERRRGLEWSDDDALREAWQRGETGYPAVDAGMRELLRTGWMHNRARLIVGSFLTKDLHVDWRAGERWFSRLLLDGEPAQNNGNWQWIASVGVDPAPPVRRMYNPTLQGKRFDPTAAFIRRNVPELADVPDHRLFEPWTMTEAEQRESGCIIGRHYPAPVVDHEDERKVALDRYR